MILSGLKTLLETGEMLTTPGALRVHACAGGIAVGLSGALDSAVSREPEARRDRG